jgi:cytochrome c556
MEIIPGESFDQIPHNGEAHVMKTNRLAQVALLLWAVMVAVLVWYFLRSRTVADTDGRTAIMLHPAERQRVLSEMRGLLVATQGILTGASRGDRMHIIAAAHAGGMASMARADPALMAKLPLEYKALNMNVHHEMDEIARAAEDGRPTAQLLKMTSDTMEKCVTCHAAWRLEASR